MTGSHPPAGAVRGEPCSAYLRRCGSDVCHLCLHPRAAHSARAQAQEDGRLTDEEWQSLCRTPARRTGGLLRGTLP
jgi:hypothetical protein